MWYKTSGRVKIFFSTLELNFSNIYISSYSCGYAYIMHEKNAQNFIYIYIYI